MVAEDLREIVADKYKPIFRFMVVVFGAIAYGAYWVIEGYSLYADQNKHIQELRQAVKKLEAQDAVARKQRARMLLNMNEFGTIVFSRHDINGDMAMECLAKNRKKYFRRLLKRQLRDEFKMVQKVGTIAQD